MRTKVGALGRGKTSWASLRRLLGQGPRMEVSMTFRERPFTSWQENLRLSEEVLASKTHHCTMGDKP